MPTKKNRKGFAGARNKNSERFSVLNNPKIRQRFRAQNVAEFLGWLIVDWLSGCWVCCLARSCLFALPFVGWCVGCLADWPVD